jgi:hypothetical protein
VREFGKREGKKTVVRQEDERRREKIGGGGGGWVRGEDSQTIFAQLSICRSNAKEKNSPAGVPCSERSRV